MSSQSGRSNNPVGRRGPSGAWSRLKPSSNINGGDPLEVYGLPSKGETRLNDFKVQETFYNKIVERYMRFCGEAGGEQLEKQFAALSMASREERTGKGGSNDDSSSSGEQQGRDESEGDEQRKKQQKLPPSTERSGLSSSRHAPSAAATASTVVASSNSSSSSNVTKVTSSTSPPTQELGVILSAMRKLRESIVSTRRSDAFAQRAYVFVIRSAILCGAWESYAPALSYLLAVIHPSTPLTATELHEFVGYRVLDAACRLGDLSLAHRVRLRYVHRDRRVRLVLAALVADHWDLFWRLRRAVDGYQRRLMEHAEAGVRLHALKCLARSYFGVERTYVERCAGMDWPALVKDCGVGWQLVDGGDWVVIRTMKPRHTAAAAAAAATEPAKGEAAVT